MRSRRIFAGAAGLSLLVAGAVTALPASAASGSSAAAGRTASAAATTTNTAAVPTPPPITWGKCADSGLQSLHATCGFLTVPLDYSHPAGAKIQLAVSRVPHTVAANQYQGVMLVNPGGPGRFRADARHPRPVRPQPRR